MPFKTCCSIDSVVPVVEKIETKRSDSLNSPKTPKPIFNIQQVPKSIQEESHRLPIAALKDEFLELVLHNQFIIVVGETGSGKSTQIPKYLAENGLHCSRKIAVTQPRRVAARSLAERVAIECGVQVGTTVGWAVRYDRNISGDTIIKFMTDGLLVKEYSTDPNLNSYSIIIIDEAHERSIHTDVCFGLLKNAAAKRPDLKVIICSATLEVNKFSEYFKNAPIFKVAGTNFKVEVFYSPKTVNNIIQVIIDTIIAINQREARGDILVFLAGQDEIELLCDLLHAKVREIASSLDDDLIVTPCYGALPFQEQQKIFKETPANYRKVVVATNIAETSLTINGIVYVIDSGFFKQNEYNSKSGIYSLVRRRISKFQAIQRTGRAGRTQPGKCYRLYSEQEYDTIMKDTTSPEITRCNLESVILDIISMGIPDPLEFDFLDPPPKEAMLEAIVHLKQLCALDGDLNLTDIGIRMSEFPVAPPLAKVIIESEKLNCCSDVLKLVALFSTQYQNIFSRRKRDQKNVNVIKSRFKNSDGDLLTLLEIYDEWLVNEKSEQWCKSLCIQYRYLAEAEKIRGQLKGILRTHGISEDDTSGSVSSTDDLHEKIRRAFTAGYFRQIAHKKIKGHAYLVLRNVPSSEEAFIHPSSCLMNSKHKPEWVMYHEVLKTTKTYMRGVTAIELSWIKEYAPEFAKKLGMSEDPSYGLLNLLKLRL